MQNKNVIDIKDQKYKIKETDQDKHTNKLLKNSKNGLLQDKYAIDENINPLNTSKKDKEDKSTVNKHKAKDNKRKVTNNKYTSAYIINNPDLLLRAHGDGTYHKPQV